MKKAEEFLLKNGTFVELLALAESDPLPQAHTSAHWQEYGPRTVVHYRDGRLLLQAHGFDGLDEHPLLGFLKAAERLSYRHVYREYRHYPKARSAGAQLVKELGGTLTSSAFTGILAASLLLDHFESHHLSISSAVIIGDGVGFMGSLVRRLFPSIQLYCVDLPKMLVFQARSHLLTSKAPIATTIPEAGDPAQTTFLHPQAIERIRGTVDLAININSMQEMNPENVREYFAFLRSRSNENSVFYCLNRERKVFSDGTESIFAEYPWMASDRVFIDSLCPFQTHFLDWQPPFSHRFDGPVRHRLVHLSRAD